MARKADLAMKHTSQMLELKVPRIPRRQIHTPALVEPQLSIFGFPSCCSAITKRTHIPTVLSLAHLI